MLGLPKYCSATNMFSSWNVDTFDAHVRKQYFSLRTRLYIVTMCMLMQLLTVI